MRIQPSWVVLSLAVLVGVAATLARRYWPSPMAGIVSALLFAVAGVLVLFSLVAWLKLDSGDCAPRAVRERYVRDFLASMGAYVVAVVVSSWLLRQVEAVPLRALVALLPVPPVALALRAVVRYIRDVDEMQRRIELEAVSIATALVSLLYLAGGFLQSAKVVDLRASMVMLMVFPLVCAVYGLSKFLVLRRYR